MQKSEHNFRINESQKVLMLPAQCVIALHSLRIAVILLVHAKKLLKLYRFESAQNLVFFLKFIRLRLFFTLFFVSETGVVPNLFLNFEQK